MNPVRHTPSPQPAGSPRLSHGVNLLPTQRASEISADEASALTQWLVEGLWSDQAVGILGGEPKCCKSFLALDLAVSVASGAPALRQFPVRRPGSVLVFPAEDSLAVVRRRLEGICSAAQVSFESLAVDVITAPSLRLDAPEDRQRLTHTVQSLRPRLLILDPLIRIHGCDENDASQVAALLSFLRQLQRQFQVAVLVVHHARKDAHSSRPGQALRGSSELHGWGDSNLYMRRRGPALTLTTEHRAAASQDNIRLELTQHDSALSLTVLAEEAASERSSNAPPTAVERIHEALAGLDEPVSVQRLRKLCGMRTTNVCAGLAQMTALGSVIQSAQGYQLRSSLKKPFPVSRPIDPPGNGNGKRREDAA